jgi:hypothetical protein
MLSLLQAISICLNAGNRAAAEMALDLAGHCLLTRQVGRTKIIKFRTASAKADA